MNYRSIVRFILALAFGLASFTSGVTPTFASNVQDLKEGQTAPAGSTLVVERVDFGSRTINVNAGVGPVTEQVQGLLHTNVWVILDGSLEQALCEQARERFTEAASPGSWANQPSPMQVFLNGSPFSGSCGGAGAPVAYSPPPAPVPVVNQCGGCPTYVPPVQQCGGCPTSSGQPNIPAPDAVRDLNPGQVSPAGQWAVVEVVNHLNKTSCIWHGQLNQPLPERALGQIDVNVWDHYGSQGSAWGGAQSLFDARSSTAQIPGSWAWGYRVAYQGQGC